MRGFHVYKTIWSPVLNEILQTQQEHGNPEDCYAVSILKGGVIVGHVPRELSSICWYFIERDGEISCKITGQRQRSPLLQGGMEIPCTYTFRGKNKIIMKLKVIMNDLDVKEEN